MAKGTKQKYIKNDILMDYVEDNDELVSNDDILKQVNLLVDNDFATKTSGMGDTYAAYTGIEFKIACKFICGLNKKIERYLNKTSGGKVFSNAAFIPEEYVELSKWILHPGVYYAMCKEKGEYVILNIEPNPDDSYMFSWTMYFIGKHSVENRNTFIKKIEKFKKDTPKTYIDIVSYLDGRPSKQCIFKSFDQMVFKGKEDIIKYIDNWKHNIPKYNQYGMIPKLSVLLYGEPGTGKSTFSKALAKYLGINEVKSLSPAFFDTNDMNNRKLSSMTYDESVYVIDDIDCIGTSRDEDNSNDNTKVISNLLEFLDNPPTFYYKADDDKYYLVSIVCATTNYFDKLDKAVKRYGRFDLKLEMNKYNEEYAQKMCDIYGLNLRDIYKGEINDDTTFSPAYIQSLCMENIDDGFKTI